MTERNRPEAAATGGTERVAQVTDEELSRIFSKENMTLLLETIRPHLEANKKKLVYLLPQANQIGQFVLEAHSLYRLYADDHDEILVVTNSSTEYKFSEGLMRLCAPYMTFIESPDSGMIRMGFFDGPSQDFGPFRPALVSADQVQNLHYQLRLTGASGQHFAPPPDMAAIGQAFFDTVGVPKGAKIITLHARDPGFMAGLGYHSYRNCPFANYGPAIDRLLEQGYWIFRLGDKTTPKLENAPERLIDLPHHPDYSDVLDVCLIARAEYHLGCSSGPTTLALMLGTPLLLLNGYAQSLHVFNDGDLVLIKRYWSHDLGRHLNYPEILDRKLSLVDATQDFAEQGLELRENTPDEILEAVQKMCARLAGNFDIDPDLDARFRALGQAYETSLAGFKPDLASGISPYLLCYSYGAPWCNYAQSFLRRHPEFLGVAA